MYLGEGDVGRVWTVYLGEGDAGRGETGIEKQGKRCGRSRGSEGSALGQELRGAGRSLSLDREAAATSAVSLEPSVCQWRSEPSALLRSPVSGCR